MTTTETTKANAQRWFAAHVGDRIVTEQYDANDRLLWAPGPRKLTKGRTFTSWSLDGSEVRITHQHTVVYCANDGVSLEWRDEAGTLIHRTDYAVVTSASFVG